jgi:hypothetical protein
MSNISYIGSPSTGISAVINGKPYTVAADNPALREIFLAIAEKRDENEIVAMFDRATAIKTFMRGQVEIRSGKVFYNGEPLHNVVVERIETFMRDGLPVEPLVNFLNRVMANDSQRTQESLFLFLEANRLPITEDGFFLGYKGVNDDYTDAFSGKIDNSPGATPPRFKRSEVDDDFRKLCSKGYHVGSEKYAVGYGSKTVIVKVDPADVVSIPDGNTDWKIRVMGYTVLCDYSGHLPSPLHTDEPYNDAVFSVEELEEITD